MAKFQHIPGVDALAQSAELASFPPSVRIEASRYATSSARDRAKAGETMAAETILDTAIGFAKQTTSPSLTSAINATGVILHTGLGRAMLAGAAVEMIHSVAANHSLTEFDPETGERGDRQSHVRELLQDLTGAEDALVVNNCAAGLFLTLSALCSNAEVILSRGQMVEIGGSFRMPDIVRQSGCQLVEVGCTNRTRQEDYEDAITEATAAILRCHPSNFRIVGFQSEVSVGELREVADRRGILLLDDVGHGCVIDPTKYGLPAHPTLRNSIEAGADIVLASGDKLLGGPQAGLILGRKNLIATIKQHPLARAVRIDKLTLAGLEGTLRLYREGRESEIPLWQSVGRDMATIKRMANRLAKAFAGSARVEAGTTEIGGGSMPGVTLPTWRVGLESASAQRLGKALRMSSPPVVGRIENQLVWLDPRTMSQAEVTMAETILREVNVNEP